jgi:hypothetical protein
MSRQLTIRGIPDEVAIALERVSRERGRSVNATVNRILAEAMGPEARLERLRRYVTWTDADAREFSEALAEQRSIDVDAWR